jgi:hypothetical protein
MAKKTPPVEKPKELLIESAIGFKLKIDLNNCDIQYDQTNEHNLAAFAISYTLIEEIITAVLSENVYAPKSKKEKRDKLERLRKLKLEIVNSISDISSYLLATKTQAEYDLLADKLKRKKSKIITATPEDTKMLKLIKP